MFWRPVLYLIPFIPFFSLHALVEQPIDEKKPLPLIFSRNSHNRICVEKGGVEKVIGDEAFFEITIDPTTGNAFINVLREILEPTTLTVVTSSGLIQDLTITSGDKLSEHLLLKEEVDQEEFKEITSNFHGHTIDFINKILEGKTPLGYGLKPNPEKEILQLPSPLATSIIKTFEGPFEEVFVLKIKNHGKDPIILESDSLKKDKASWVFLNSHELRAKEQALCIISYPKSEG